MKAGLMETVTTDSTSGYLQVGSTELSKSSRTLLTPARQAVLARMLDGSTPVRVSPDLRP